MIFFLYMWYFEFDELFVYYIEMFFIQRFLEQIRISLNLD